MITQHDSNLTTTPAILVNNLSKSVGDSINRIDILHNLQLEVHQRESVAIIGSSGCGKSTLLGILAGLDVPSSGDVKIDGAVFSDLDEDARAAIRGKHMGFVFQSFQLLPALTALENVMIPLQLANRVDAREVALTALAQVGLSERISHYPKQLSGGEQQRVAIARAFALQPAILFADEPTGNLDSGTGKQIIDLLFTLNKQAATTLVLVTHDNQLAQQCERVYSLQDGMLNLVEMQP
jgi:putative ABC transport system ATP-binding protein